MQVYATAHTFVSPESIRQLTPTTSHLNLVNCIPQPTQAR
jgi:hypothetical protein